MNKIKALTSFLISLDLVAAENIESFVDDPKIIPSGKCLSHNSIVLYRQDYTATIYIEDFPHKEHPAELLFGHLCSWLLNNDDRQEIAQPTVNVDVLDNDTANIEISIEFKEDVEAIEDDAGPIELFGFRYRILESDIYYAETGDVVT